MQKMRIKFKHLGIGARSRTLRNLVLKSWNLAWCHVMVLPCRSKKNGRIGTNFGISFLQTGASLKKARGSERERVTFECEMIYAVPLEFLYRGSIELHECLVKIWNYSGFVWPFLYINWVFGHLMCIIQIWTASTCSGAPKLVEKSHVCPCVNFKVPCKKWEWNSNIWASWLG